MRIWGFMDTAISDSMKLHTAPSSACEGPPPPCLSLDRSVVWNAFSGIPAVQSYSDQSKRRGDLIHDGAWDVYVSQLLRASANMFTCAQDRNLKGRFKFSGHVLTSLVKCPVAHVTDSDLGQYCLVWLPVGPRIVVYFLRLRIAY